MAFVYRLRLLHDNLVHNQSQLSVSFEKKQSDQGPPPPQVNAAAETDQRQIFQALLPFKQ